MPKQTAEIMIRQNKMKMPFPVIVHGRRGPARSPAAMRRPPPICMLYPVARVIFIFLEMTLVMSPPKAVQHALRRIIPSPRIVMSAKKSSPGLMLMETIAAILILFPVLLGVVTTVGVDPMQFGVLCVLNLVIGLCTPPVGVCLFAATNIGETKLTGVIRELVPFVVSNIIVLLLVSFVPAITVGFSNLVMGAG